MAKEDIQWAVLGILILVVVALVIKPVATGQPVNIGLPTSTPAPPNITITSVPTQLTTIPTPATPVPTATPTATPTWDSSVKTVQFVDPATYGLDLNQSLPNFTKFPPDDAAFRSSNLTTYAQFSGQYSGATQIVTIPFPYWELWYSVVPQSTNLQQQAEASGMYVITPTQGEGVSRSGFSGSYSTAMPVFSIQVMDAEDPNRIVRAVTPPGNLDPSLWVGNDDPRPWKEKFYEGQHSYYFVIKASVLKSYTIDIKIPSSYVGKY